VQRKPEVLAHRKENRGILPKEQKTDLTQQKDMPNSVPSERSKELRQNLPGKRGNQGPITVFSKKTLKGKKTICPI